MSEPRKPDLDEIEDWFAALVQGRVSRDAADRWAARWFLDDTVCWGETERWALRLLFGIDLRHGPDAEYLHDDEQVRGWWEELRARRASATDDARTD